MRVCVSKLCGRYVVLASVLNWDADGDSQYVKIASGEADGKYATQADAICASLNVTKDQVTRILLCK